VVAVFICFLGCWWGWGGVSGSWSWPWGVWAFSPFLGGDGSSLVLGFWGGGGLMLCGGFWVVAGRWGGVWVGDCYLSSDPHLFFVFFSSPF